MSEINLLPKELRKREEQEQARQVEHKSDLVYSQPSVLAERLRQAEAAEVSWWSKIKNWFNKYPEPVTESTELAEASKPDQAKVKEIKPVKEDFKVKKDFSLTDWWQDFIGAKKKETTETPAPPVPKPTPAPVVPASPKPPLHHPAKKSATAPEVPIGVVLDVNLLPVSSQPSKAGPYLKKLLVIAISSLAIVVLVYAIIYTLINRQEVEVKKVQEEARMLVKEVDNKKAKYDELELVSRKMKIIKQVAAQRNDWLKFFSELQKITLPNVSFNSLQAAGSGTIVLQAQALTVADLAKQLKSFQQADKMISGVAIGSISVNQDTETKQVTVVTEFRLELVAGWLTNQ